MNQSSHQHVTLTRTTSIAAVLLLVTYLVLAGGKNGLNAMHAFLGGLLPALFWLWFWLHEDKLHPEPKKIIFTAFFLGMVAVPLAIAFEQWYMSFAHPGVNGNDALNLVSIADLFAWAVIEEMLKYGMAFFAGLRSAYFDEPIDAVMYLISVALGFAALENMLFIFNSLSLSSATALSDGFVLSQLRFVGASLLHVASSAFIGFGIGFGLCKPKWTRVRYFLFGLAGAFALHTVFNYLIIVTNGEQMLPIFSLLWIIIIFIIILFEKIKKSPCYQTPAVQS